MVSSGLWVAALYFYVFSAMYLGLLLLFAGFHNWSYWCKLVLCYLGLFWGGCLNCLNFNFWGLVSLLLPFRIGFGIVGAYKWLVVRGFVTWGGVLLVWNLGNFNSAVCDALVGCVGTCIVVTVCVLLHRLICGVGFLGLLFYYLGVCVPKLMGVGLSFMGWCLWRLRRFSGLGLVCVWTFCRNVGFCGPWITFVLIVLVGRLVSDFYWSVT